MGLKFLLHKHKRVAAVAIVATVFGVLGFMRFGVFNRTQGATRLPASTPPVAAEQSDLYKQHPGSVFLTLSSHFHTKGTMHTGDNDKQYITDVFGLIIQNAHEIAKSDYDEDNKWTYYAFLVAALTVPFHESQLMHFRSSLGKKCYWKTNAGLKLKQFRPAYWLFTEYLRDPQFPIVPDCGRLEADSAYTQILASYQLLDMGVMQLNFNYNQDHVISGGFFDLNATIKHGLGYLYDGFSQIRLTYSRYSCIKSGKFLNFSNLIRGTWAGKYNAGGVTKGKVCRFSSKSDPRDTNFLMNLKKVLCEDGDYYWKEKKKLCYDAKKKTASAFYRKGVSHYHKYLEGVEKEALDEIVENFFKNTNKREALKKVLEKGYNQVALDPEVIVEHKNPTHWLWSRAVNIRSAPDAKAHKCGKIDNPTRWLSVVILSEEEGDWYKIQLRDDSLFLDTKSKCPKDSEYYIWGKEINKRNPGPVIALGEVTSNILNVRVEKPSGRVIEVLSQGDKVGITQLEILKKSDAPWYRIAPHGGWVYGKYIKIIPDGEIDILGPNNSD